MPMMCSMQTHRWRDGRQLVRSRLDRPAGKVAAFYAAMPSTTFRRLTGQVPTLLEGTIVGRAGGEHVYGVVRPDDATATSREQSDHASEAIVPQPLGRNDG